MDDGLVACMVLLLVTHFAASYKFTPVPRPIKTLMRFSSSIDGDSHQSSFIESIGNYCIEDCIGGSLKKKFGENSTEILKARPGLPFSLGCDQWKANGLSGSVETWSANACMNWLCRSSMRIDRGTPSSINTTVAAINNQEPSVSANNSAILLEELQIYTSVTDIYDIPNLKMSVGLWQLPLSSLRTYKLQLDYVPREDMLASLDYFDRYFTGLDEEIYNATHSMAAAGAITFLEPSSSVLSRMLTSAFDLSINIAEDRTDLVRQLCESHINTWCKWMTEAKELTDPAKQQQIRSRDLVIQGLHFDDFKFRMARVMGADFAPKAADIAASLVGPKISSD
jgi:hypothetical protein